ncbi:hypothetical protein SVAN01_11062 [Stagonosporopsis vannaccii]|nr:hypothetical protein SVAN01_11062 [Stagonosporopsis vannaccii]
MEDAARPRVVGMFEKADDRISIVQRAETGANIAKSFPEHGWAEPAMIVEVLAEACGAVRQASLKLAHDLTLIGRASKTRGMTQRALTIQAQMVHEA